MNTPAEPLPARRVRERSAPLEAARRQLVCRPFFVVKADAIAAVGPANVARPLLAELAASALACSAVVDVWAYSIAHSLLPRAQQLVMTLSQRLQAPLSLFWMALVRCFSGKDLDDANDDSLFGCRGAVSGRGVAKSACGGAAGGCGDAEAGEVGLSCSVL
eukprot:2591795-Prymnesium_polylepis.3